MRDILLDMDGVLPDFQQGAFDIHGFKTTPEEAYQNHLGCWDILEVIKMPAKEFWVPMEKDFWANLEWMPDGREILNLVEQRFGRESITLWTSPSLNEGCVPGKIAWIEKHLPRYYRHHVVFGSKKHLGARSTAILIDDSDANCNKFAAYGGKVVLPPRIWNSDYSNRHRVLDSIAEQLEVIL